MIDDSTYDLAVIGGGLAGLALSIQVSKKGFRTILFEKEQYPFHRVCGEYISMESWNFLHELGMNLQALNISRVTELEVSSVNGKLLKQKLPLGGFGISRYLLDHELSQISKENGTTILDNTRVNEITFLSEEFLFDTSKGNFKAKVVAGCFGKRSNLDIKWQRPFIVSKKNKLNNYIGVKYHVHSDFPDNSIALHNFKKGYCGIVKVEDDKYCLCYLTTAANLVNSGGNVKQLEENILSENPYLKKILRESKKITDEPVIISQISFDKKTQIEDHVLMIGDAAGMITPLCGNGMSMALHGSKIASEQIISFLNRSITREMMEKNYSKQWNKLFARRMKTGRWLQSFFGNKWLTNSLIMILKPFPFLVRALIRQTHGQPF